MVLRGLSNTGFSYVVPGPTSDRFSLGFNLNPLPAVLTWSCTAAGSGGPNSSTTNTDSLKVRALQVAATKTAAAMSGDAITGAINGAISDTFRNGAVPFTMSPNGIVFKFTGEPQRPPSPER